MSPLAFVLTFALALLVGWFARGAYDEAEREARLEALRGRGPQYPWGD